MPMHLLVAGLLFAFAQKADAVTINLNGVNYDVTAVTTTYSASSALLMSNPWWGDSALASSAANQVGTDLGLPNSNPGFVDMGPLFTFQVVSSPPPETDSISSFALSGPPGGSLSVAQRSDGVGATFTFAIIVPGVTLTATAGPGGSISPSGTVFAALGSSTNVIITPGLYYAVSNVLVNGSSVGPVTNYAFNDIQSNVTIHADFAPLMTSPGSYSANGFMPGILAPPGYYVPNAGATNLTAASPGYYVPDFGASNQTAAAPGTYAPFAGMSTSITASAGYYVGTQAATTMTAAVKGYFVDTDGATNQTPAQAGQYTPIGGMQTALLAPLGYYAPTNSLSEITPAPVGYFVGELGSAQPTPAPIGRYAPVEGLHMALNAPLGYYVNQETSSVPIAAAPGWIVPFMGANTQQMVQAGFYAPVAGMSAGIPAPPGYYTSSNGATTLTAAAPGYYVPDEGRTNATPAEAGRVAPISGMRGTILLGDTNGDDRVTQEELDAVVGNFWENTGTLEISAFEVHQDGTIMFGLTNALGSSLDVQVSTNLSSFSTLGTATPVYRFYDQDVTNSVTRFYKLGIR